MFPTGLFSYPRRTLPPGYGKQSASASLPHAGSRRSRQEKTAQTARLPGISIGATTGYIGQSTVFRQGLTQPVHPDLPDWSHNYNVEVTQPVYRGGKIHYNIKRASLEKQIAALNSASSKAEVKLLLLRQYMDLFSLYKQKTYLPVTWKESTRRLEDIRRLKKEGIVTRNDELRSELQLTNDQLACREADDNIAIVSQQLDVLLGLDETFLLQPDTALLYTAVSLESYDTYVQQAYLNYPELQIARYNTKLAENDIFLSKPTICPHSRYVPPIPWHARWALRWKTSSPTTGISL